MRLPDALQNSIHELTAHVPRAELRTAAAELSRRYTSAGPSGSAFLSEAHRAAYLLTRMPATYAACARVLRELKRHGPAGEVQSLIDLGAGPGTAAFAAAELWPALERVTCVERDAGMVALGRQLAQPFPQAAIQRTIWITGDAMSAAAELPQHDLVIAAYAAGESRKEQTISFLQSAWKLTSKYLIIIEPGTPSSTQKLLLLRDAMLDAGAHVLAPCPHERECPWKSSGTDWCHFAQRVERTSEHRKLKGGELPFEDEKFSYMIFSRAPVENKNVRIVRHPLFRKGHVKMTLCTMQGIEPHVVTKSQKESYKLARKAEWGDGWE